MNKVIIPSASDFDAPIARLVDVGSVGVDHTWMVKRAAAGVFSGVNLKPEADHSIIHLIAMGDSEVYGNNRNGDIFFKQARTVVLPNPKKGQARELHVKCGNLDRHKTFETHAKVYRNHVNKDPKKAHGSVVKSAHNADMSRVELLIRVPNEGWRDELEKLASGQDISFSMACRLPADFCSVCGNRAPSRDDYCEHLAHQMSQITKEGHAIGAINDFYTFFDISKVVVPADRIALGLLKAASARVVSGTELAEQFTLFPPGEPERLAPSAAKYAMLKKLAEIEKIIDAKASSRDQELDSLAMGGKSQDLPDELSELLGSASRDNVDGILTSLADAKITLSVKDFLRVLMGSKFKEVEPQVKNAESLLPGVFGRILLDADDLDDFDLGHSEAPALMRTAIQKVASTHGMTPEAVRGRAIHAVLRGSQPIFVGLNKEASDNQLAEGLARTYAKYKVACLERMRRSDKNSPLTELLVVPHYVRC